VLWKLVAVLKSLVERAGGTVTQSAIREVNLSHYLAFILREYIEKIPDPVKRADLLSRWSVAYKQIVLHGAEHPPVGVISAEANDI